MSRLKVIEQLEDFVNRIISLLNANLRYYRIAAYEQVVHVITILLGRLILLGTFLIVSLFASVWLSFFLGELIGKLSLGFLLVALLYLIVGLIFYKNRVQWFINPVLKEFSKVIEEQNRNHE
jgi:CHASE3 domain sensor protein